MLPCVQRRISGSIGPMQSALDVVHEYYRAFSTLELSALVSYFSEPFMSIGPQGIVSIKSRADLANAFFPLIEGLSAGQRGMGEASLLNHKS
jgi:hypothetical protein